MKKSVKFILGAVIFILAFSVVAFNFQNQSLPLNASTLHEKLVGATDRFKTVSGINHLLLIIVILGGYFGAAKRNYLYLSFMIYLCACAAVCGFIQGIYLNSIYFPAIAGLIAYAAQTGKIRFDAGGLSVPEKIAGGAALAGGFWYLALVQSPVYLNALIYSPLGIVNCPTTLALCGFLILNTEKEHRPRSLEISVICGALFFGGLGILTMKVYFDIVLVCAALFIAGRIWKEVRVWETKPA
jgi:hypothetical protein